MIYVPFEELRLAASSISKSMLRISSSSESYRECDGVKLVVINVIAFAAGH